MTDSDKLAHLVARWGLQSNHITGTLVKSEQMAGGTAAAGVLPALAPTSVPRPGPGILGQQGGNGSRMNSIPSSTLNGPRDQRSPLRTLRPGPGQSLRAQPGSPFF